MCLLKDYKGDPVAHVHCSICGNATFSGSPCVLCVWRGRDEGLTERLADEEEDF